MEWYQVLESLSQPLISIASIIVAILLYKLNRLQREDTWLRTLRDFHQYFWSDPVLREVRAWIACDNAYRTVQPILEKRRKAEFITKEEYEVLEKIDKFASLLTSYKRIGPSFKQRKVVTERIFDSYWLGVLTTKSRDDLIWYICYFYPELQSAIYVTPNRQIVNQ